MASALIDASALVAMFGPGQPHGERYRDLLELAGLERWVLSTTWPCVVEASYLLAPPQRFDMLNWLGEGAVSVFPFGQEALLDFVPLMRRYTERPRTEMDLADASLYWLAADTGITRIMTLDKRDFSRYRLPDGRAFEIL
ncbi:PIN domain-containing protein [Vandammella animalimorsus]|uniref:Ribonuclease VapC n=1 Tax=Vandammella animalimorsus TaxID=2029117 RepID=A0A2A2AM73_9BURK|nr:PIN domain-containing protein [Vandammella animalimorsus]PAT38486.1 PIN domain-containing protein [Vandammella animalimorsus]PAT38843.1 PIN domain-containing protein [Vandammella animalimorsus]